MMEYPYQKLREVNQARSQQEREYELEDTGAFDNDRYWEVTVVSSLTSLCFTSLSFLHTLTHSLAHSLTSPLFSRTHALR